MYDTELIYERYNSVLINEKFIATVAAKLLPIIGRAAVKIILPILLSQGAKAAEYKIRQVVPLNKQAAAIDAINSTSKIDYKKVNYNDENFIKRVEELVSYLETGVKPEPIRAIPKFQKPTSHVSRFKNAYEIALGGRQMGNDINNMSYPELNKIYRGAKGKYQIIPPTFEYLVQRGLYNEVPDARKNFSPETQDKIFFFMIRNKSAVKNAVAAFKQGHVDRAIRYLSQEWASIPKDKSNESYYKGTSNNKALVSYSDVENFLLGNIDITQVKKR